jgi:hypothetical protein
MKVSLKPAHYTNAFANNAVLQKSGRAKLNEFLLPKRHPVG